GVGVLHDHAERLDPLQHAGERGRATADELVHLGEPGGRKVAAVPGDPAAHVLGSLLRLVERALRRDHLLDQRPQLRERGVRLVRCEDPLQPAKYDRAAWALLTRFSRFASPAFAPAWRTCASRWPGGRRSASSPGAGRRSGQARSSPGSSSSPTATRTPRAGTIRRSPGTSAG